MLQGPREGLPFLTIVLRVVEPIHFGGQFERPFDVTCPLDEETHEYATTAPGAAIYFASEC